MEYTEEQLKKIDDGLKEIGVEEYRFLLESNRYVCDKNGNIYSVCRGVAHGIAFRIRKIKLMLNTNGYYTFLYCVGKKQKRYAVHRVIAKAWYGDHPELVVNHKDGDRGNNNLINLEFCTKKENNIHGANLKRYKINYEKGIYAYLLLKYYNVSETKTQQILKMGIREMRHEATSAEKVLKHFELTKEQVKKCIDECFEMDDSEINKELLKKYLAP